MVTEEYNSICNDNLTQSDIEFYHLSNKLDMQMEDFENRIAEFERRRKFILLLMALVTKILSMLI